MFYKALGVIVCLALLAPVVIGVVTAVTQS